MSEMERVVEKAKHEEEVEKITPAAPLLEYFNRVDEILRPNFIWQKEQEKEQLENVKREYQIDILTDHIDSGQVPEILDFYFGGENKNFLEKINSLKPNQETAFFIDFLMTDFGSQLMKENNLSIHIQAGDLYYNGTNMGESIYNLVLAQNDSSKKIVKEKLYYAGSFEEYLSEFLAGFSAEEDAKLDTLTNKSIKYLFYRYNESLIFHSNDPVFIVHTKASADEVVLESLHNTDWQYLVETVIEKAETDGGYFNIRKEKEARILKKMTKNYKGT